MRGCRPLTQHEVHQVAQSFDGRYAQRDRAIFLLGVKTGFRISEILSLRLGDVIEENGALVERITVRRRHMKKKIESRSVAFVHQTAREALTKWLVELREAGYLHEELPLFPSQRNKTRPISRVQYYRILEEAFDREGLQGELGTHSMRKTFANNIYNYYKKLSAAGKIVDPFRATSKALGHKNINSTDQYLSFNEEQLLEALIHI